ncbi:MAG: lipid IV(A) palmitoyltransferase PagP [Legionellaceae bacterium]|nr:lipid IV(A) palmitoyltransferase PagP [Legionellaceae bacterium]
MKHIIKSTLLSLILLNSAFAKENPQAKADEQEKSQPATTSKKPIFKSPLNLLRTILKDGKNELYLPTYAWHNRYLYSKDRIKRYNENPWGGGLGKSFYDDDGDWHGLYAFAFLDSHKNVEPILGYAFLKVLQINEDTNVGGGFALLVTARPDINKGIPFPGALPWVAVSYQRLSFVATYIPGNKNVGNVLFLITKILL